MCLQAFPDGFGCTVGSDTESNLQRLRTKSQAETTLTDKYFKRNKHKTEILFLSYI